MHSEAVMKLASLNSATGGIDVRVNAQVEHDQKTAPNNADSNFLRPLSI